jgi:PKD repeat protein
MKYIYNFMIIALGIFVSVSIGNGQNPTYTLDINDLTVGDSSGVGTLDFDIEMTWTNSGIASNYEFAGAQYFFDFNKDAIQPGTTWQMKSIASDLPANMQPRGPTVYTVTTPGQLRWAVNTFPGAGYGFAMPANTPVKIVRVRLKVIGGDGRFAVAPLNLVWRNALPNPFTKVFAYVGTTNTDISTPQTHTISIPNDPLPGVSGIIANFYSSSRSIVQGQSINFFDSTYGTSSPNSWNWTFTGATPSSSTVQNPANIRYDVPGTYNVSLSVSSPLHSNSITKTNYITVLPGCISTWKQTIRVNDAGSANDSIKFGMSPSGSNGIDTCLGEVPVPPPPPTGVFDCRFILPTNDAVKTDMRRDSLGSTIWRMTFQPSISGYPITFNWNIASFPATGGFFLKDEITGTLVNVNMRNQNSYTLTTSGITSLKIEYNNITLASSVTSGWNIVSVPVRTSDMLYSTLFPGVASPAYAYSNGYVSISMLSNGTGYWMKFNNAANFNFTGYPWTPENMLVSPGWNLIGPFDNNIPISSIMSNPAGIVTSNYFGYNGGYYNPDTLKVGRGYWIRTSTAGYLYQGSADNNPNAIATNPLEDFVEVRFTNGDDNSTALYLGNATELTSDYSMPPVPPSGIFDVRFATDKFVEELGKIHTLKLNSASGQTRITLHNARGLKMKIKDAIDGTIINKEIEEGTEIIIPANLENLVLETNGIIPKTYELSQNYPNPFNPVTTIKYQIPDDGLVKLIVFDVLGREVKTLVNSVQTAGVYEVRFDASDVASGVYFYKLLAGKFEDLKKMIILK